MRELTWIFCHGHAGVQGIELADRLAVKAEIQGRLRMGKRGHCEGRLGQTAGG